MKDGGKETGRSRGRVKVCPDCGHPMYKSQGQWNCDECGATAPLRSRPTQAPDSSLYLGPERRAWLITKFGGIQPGVKALIDAAMAAENERQAYLDEIER